MTAPHGTLAESFFDPYADGSAVTGTTTVGTIRWGSGEVEATLTQDVTDQVLDFFGLDGAVTLSLAVDDATETSGTLSWEVATQPWIAGDKLMPRIRGIGCTGGAAVTDTANNPELVSNCETLLMAKDTLVATGTLNWDEHTAITRWDGVTVGGMPRGVTELVLYSHDLGGGIPPELGSLKYLERLELSSNGLTGQIPRGLGKLSELKDLGLAGNKLTGSIPRELGNLKNLRQLWAYDNQLVGRIPPELGKLTGLRKLELQDNLLRVLLQWELTGLSNLSTLNLSGNQLQGCIPSSLRSVMSNDLEESGLPDCTEDGGVPAPERLSVSLTGGAFSLSWDAVQVALRYEVQYRIAGAGDGWSSIDTTTDTKVTYSPEGGHACNSTYEFRVLSHVEVGFGSWQLESAVESVTTEACNP